MLQRQFGKNGLIYFNFARSMDDRPVEAVRIRKSIGCEHTLEKDLSAESEVRRLLPNHPQCECGTAAPTPGRHSSTG